MTEDLADRIMFRIEREGAIHKSSIVQEVEWFQFQQVCAENVSEKVSKGARSVQDEINNLIKNSQERMKIEEAFCGITDLLRGTK